MNLLFLIPKNCYYFQHKILEQLLSVSGASCHVFFVKKTVKKRTNDFLPYKFIEKRFPIYKISPFDEKEVFETEKLKIFNEETNLKFNFIIDLSENSSLDFSKFNFEEILRPKMDENYWKACPALRMEKTFIEIMSSKNAESWSVKANLPFYSEKGIYCNRDKALFYFQYLFKYILTQKKLDFSEKEKVEAGNLQKAGYNIRLFCKIFSRKFRRNNQNWKLAIRKENINKIINAEKGIFWADPFIVKNNENFYIFFEEISENEKKGKICMIEIDKEAKILQKKCILEKDFHLSFPNILELGDKQYLLPEQSESNRQDIYVTKNFPEKWEYYTTLLENKKIIDPEIIFYNGKYWLFCNIIEEYEHENNERLYIFYSDEVFGNWKEHPENPVVIDKSKARNAGKILKEDKVFVRPAQSCVTSYGEYVSFQKIEKLDEKNYKEITNSKIFPTKDFVGLHTFNKVDSLEIIDVLKKE